MIRHLRVLSVLFALACGGGRTIVVDGRTVPYEEAAQAALTRARTDAANGQHQKAADDYARFLQEFADSESADEARVGHAHELAALGKLQDARAELRTFLEQRPASRFKNEASVELGIVESKLGNKQDAAQALKPTIDQMSEDEKKRAAQTLSEAYKNAGDSGEAARWGAKAVEGAQGPEREARLEEFAQKLAQAPAADVAKLVAELDKNSPAWPTAALRLARIQLHVGDRTHAGELAGEVLQKVQTGPLADGARSVQLAVNGTANVKPSLVGIVLPLTGSLKAFAEASLDAIALKLDLQNRGPIQVSVKDSRNDPDGAAQAVEELAREGAVAILGPIGVVEGPAAAVRAQQLGIPMISLSRAESVTQMGPWVFRNMLTNSAQAKAVADYAQKKLGAKTFGILQPDTTYGDEMVRYFWDTLDAGGSEVRAYERYPQQTTTFKPFISRMVGRANLSERGEYVQEAEKIAQEITDPYRRRKALSQLKSNTAPIVDFDALFIPDNAKAVRLIAPAVAAEDVITNGCDQRDFDIIKKTTKRDDLRAVQLLGTSLWDSADLVDEKVGAARYVQCSIFADSFFPQSQRPATRKFVEDYDAAYHRLPSFLEAHAYDAAGLLREVIEKRHPNGREQLRDLLQGLQKPFEGATGDLKFGADREAQKQLFWLWISRGTIQEFDPEGAPPVPPVGAATAADEAPAQKSKR